MAFEIWSRYLLAGKIPSPLCTPLRRSVKVLWKWSQNVWTGDPCVRCISEGGRAEVRAGRKRKRDELPVFWFHPKPLAMHEWWAILGIAFSICAGGAHSYRLCFTVLKRIAPPSSFGSETHFRRRRPESLLRPCPVPVHRNRLPCVTRLGCPKLLQLFHNR